MKALAKVEECKGALEALCARVESGDESAEPAMWAAFEGLAKAEDAYRLVRYGFAQTFPHPNIACDGHHAHHACAGVVGRRKAHG